MRGHETTDAKFRGKQLRHLKRDQSTQRFGKRSWKSEKGLIMSNVVEQKLQYISPKCCVESSRNWKWKLAAQNSMEVQCFSKGSLALQSFLYHGLVLLHPSDCNHSRAFTVNGPDASPFSLPDKTDSSNQLQLLFKLDEVLKHTQELWWSRNFEPPSVPEIILKGVIHNVFLF